MKQAIAEYAKAREYTVDFVRGPGAMFMSPKPLEVVVGPSSRPRGAPEGEKYDIHLVVGAGADSGGGKVALRAIPGTWEIDTTAPTSRTTLESIFNKLKN